MAENEIDKLSIDIKVKENKVAGRINTITLSVQNLTKAIKGFDQVSKALNKIGVISNKINAPKVKSTHGSILEKMPEPKTETSTANIKDFGTVKNLKKTEEELKKLSESSKSVLEPMVSEEQKLNLELVNTTYELSNQNKFIKDKVKNNLLTQQDVDKQKELRKKLEDIKNKKKELIKINLEQDNLQKKNNKNVSMWEKLQKSALRVGFYRVIRGALREVTQAMKEGTQNLANVNEGYAKSLGQIQSSITVLKNSVGVAIMPLIQAATPLIQGLANSIAQVANVISYVIAKLTGQAKFWKVNTKYLKEYNKEQGKLLSFDTFTTLATNGEDTSDMFEEVETSSTGLFSELNNINGVIKLIGETLLVIGSYKLITWIMDGGITKIKTGLEKIKSGVAGIYDKISPLAAGVTGIFVAVDGIKGILNWDETTSGLKKTLDILKIIFGVVAGIAATIAMFAGVTTTGKIAKAVAVGAAAAAVITTAISTISGYANGGIYESGDYFKANENGRTELIASNNTGGGSVMNISQWEQISEIAFYNALSRYNAKQNGTDGGINLNQLGTTIARNSSFIGEMNRKNAGLNLK